MWYLFHITSEGEQGREQLAVEQVHGLLLLLLARLLSTSPQCVEHEGVEQFTGRHLGLTVARLRGQLNHARKEAVCKPYVAFL